MRRLPLTISTLLIGFCSLHCRYSDRLAEPPRSDDTASFIRYEAAVKLDIARRTRGGPLWLAANVAVHELSLGGIPVSPYGIARKDAHLFLIDGGRRILAAWDGSSPNVSPIPSRVNGETLEIPFELHELDGSLYVMDGSTFRIIGPKLNPVRSTRFFHSIHSFLPVAENRTVLNVLNTTGAGELLLVDGEFTTLRTFSMALDQGTTSPVAYGLARLARCGRQIAAAYRHRPLVLLLDTALQTAHEVRVAVPRAQELMTSDQRAPRKRNELIGWHPSYFSGIACAGSTLFVLLDLPVLRIYQFSVDGQLQRIIGTDIPGADQTFERLVASETSTGFPLYSILRTSDGRSRVAVITESDRPTPLLGR